MNSIAFKSSELNIVSHIVKREGCLEALQQLLEAAKSSQQLVDPKALIIFRSVIDQLRSLSVLIVENIDEWQQAQKAQAQTLNFKWRGADYLLKMTADLDFLASYRSVAILESLRELKLTQNPFLAQMHLNHPALREDKPEPAFQIFGNRVGNVSILRIFSASKLLLRERDAEARCRLDRLDQFAERLDRGSEPFMSANNVQNCPVTHELIDENGIVAKAPSIKHQLQLLPEKSQFVDQDEDQASSGTAFAFTHAQEVAECEDIALSRELVTQAEREVEAIRYDLADLQARLNSAVLADERRWLQTRIGCLVNNVKFRSGDVYQRKNELKRKVAMYRATKDSCGSSGDRRARARNQTISHAYVATDNDQNDTIYSDLFETALLEDELMRHDFVERVNSLLLEAKAGTHTSAEC